MKTFYEVKQQEWKDYNKDHDTDPRKFSSRRCEECGVVGFSAEKVHRLRRKIIYNVYTLGGVKNFGIWQCKNKILCEKWAELYRSGKRIPEEGLWI